LRCRRVCCRITQRCFRGRHCTTSTVLLTQPVQGALHLGVGLHARRCRSGVASRLLDELYAAARPNGVDVGQVGLHGPRSTKSLLSMSVLASTSRSHWRGSGTSGMPTCAQCLLSWAAGTRGARVVGRESRRLEPFSCLPACNTRPGNCDRSSCLPLTANHHLLRSSVGLRLSCQRSRRDVIQPWFLTRWSYSPTAPHHVQRSASACRHVRNDSVHGVLMDAQRVFSGPQ
jgi:hypothetical protein